MVGGGRPHVRPLDRRMRFKVTPTGSRADGQPAEEAGIEELLEDRLLIRRVGVEQPPKLALGQHHHLPELVDVVDPNYGNVGLFANLQRADAAIDPAEGPPRPDRVPLSELLRVLARVGALFLLAMLPAVTVAWHFDMPPARQSFLTRWGWLFLLGETPAYQDGTGTMWIHTGDAWVDIDGKKMAPPEISAKVLQKMKKTAEDYLGEPVKWEMDLKPRDKHRDTRAMVEVPVDPTLLAAGSHNGSTFYEHVRFLAVVRGEAQPEVTLRDGMRAVEMGMAAQEAALSGQTVHLAEPVTLPDDAMSRKDAMA